MLLFWLNHTGGKGATVTVKELEEYLTNAIDTAIAKGWTITRRLGKDTASKRCCAMGAVAVAENIELRQMWDYMHAKYPRGHHFNVVSGFDGDPEIKASEFYDLGVKLRMKYCP